jgi:hypothetical protein
MKGFTLSFVLPDSASAQLISSGFHVISARTCNTQCLTLPNVTGFGELGRVDPDGERKVYQEKVVRESAIVSRILASYLPSVRYGPVC